MKAVEATQSTTGSVAPRRYEEALETALGIPFTRGNRVRILRNGVEIFPAMLEAIRNARESVCLLTFIYWKGDIAWAFADTLAERAEAGVRVRVILDALGASLMPRSLLQRMEAAGVELVWFRPTVRWKIWQADNRTHRKVLVCDGRIGFTGGVGIAEEWEGDARNPSEWRDTHLQVEGPAVRGLQSAFTGNWLEADRPVTDNLLGARPESYSEDIPVQVIKTTATAADWSCMATAMRALLALAEHKVRITTAYFVPMPPFVTLLQQTVQRGVDVQILVPGPHHDHPTVRMGQEHEYAPLMEAGVRMWAYQPTMLHAKSITIDGAAACTGSANFDHRSLSKDDELAMVVLDRSVVGTLDAHFEADRARAVEMSPRAYRRRGLLRTTAARALSTFRNEM